MRLPSRHATKTGQAIRTTRRCPAELAFVSPLNFARQPQFRTNWSTTHAAVLHDGLPG